MTALGADPSAATSATLAMLCPLSVVMIAVAKISMTKNRSICPFRKSKGVKIRCYHNRHGALTQIKGSGAPNWTLPVIQGPGRRSFRLPVGRRVMLWRRAARENV